MIMFKKDWCVVFKKEGGVFGVRHFQTRREMREDYNVLKSAGFTCKKFRQHVQSSNKGSIVIEHFVPIY